MRRKFPFLLPAIVFCTSPIAAYAQNSASDNFEGELSVKELVDAVRSELVEMSAKVSSSGGKASMELDTLVIEVSFAVEKEVSGEGGLSFWVVEAKSGGRYSSANTHRVNLTFNAIRDEQGRSSFPVATTNWSDAIYESGDTSKIKLGTYFRGIENSDFPTGTMILPGTPQVSSGAESAMTISRSSLSPEIQRMIDEGTSEVTIVEPQDIGRIFPSLNTNEYLGNVPNNSVVIPSDPAWTGLTPPNTTRSLIGRVDPNAQNQLLFEGSRQ